MTARSTITRVSILCYITAAMYNYSFHKQQLKSSKGKGNSYCLSAPKRVFYCNQGNKGKTILMYCTYYRFQEDIPSSSADNPLTGKRKQGHARLEILCCWIKSFPNYVYHQELFCACSPHFQLLNTSCPKKKIQTLIPLTVSLETQEFKSTRATKHSG